MAATVRGQTVNCCAGCFSDQVLIEHINDEGELGDCDFCGDKDIPVVEAADLWDLFEPLVRLYEEVSPDNVPSYLMDEYGETIDTLIHHEWGVFSDAVCDRTHDLMAAIIPEARHKDDIGAFPDVYELYIPYEQCWWYRSPDDYWGEFVNHIKTERRFVMSKTGAFDEPVFDPREWVPEVVQSVEKQLLSGEIIWRARRADEIGVNADPEKSPSEDDLGPPPPGKARAGRANAEGISVFYGAMDAYTAAVEVRPALGQQVWVAQWTLRQDASLVDLTKTAPLGSPFGTTDYHLKDRIEKQMFCRQLSAALSLPINPNEEQLAYIPTQYVVEVIRDAGYDGVLYMSVQDPNGTNIVLFDKDVLDPPGAKLLTTATQLSVDFGPPLT